MDCRQKANRKNIAIQSLEAGIDEAGRGCLAGPVVACAVILPESYDLPNLADSKKLSSRQRAILAFKIKQCCIASGFGIVWPARIDSINILQASLEAMAIAASWLKTPPCKLLLDGNQTIHKSVLSRFWQKRHLTEFPVQSAIIGGDAKIPAISAASILAKTWRDKLMTSLARIWPAYGFDKHKGYGTREHFLALKANGPCSMHRLTFRGVVADKQASLL